MKKNNPNININNSVTLVLNASYLPLAVCSSKRALCLYFLNKVDVLMSHDKFIYSPSTRIKVPSVVKLKTYVSYNSLEVVLNRKNLLLRDNSCCQYCGSKSNLTVDHIIPKLKGGSDTWENLIVACSPCNAKKGSRTLKEANMKLMKQPKKTNRFMYFNQFVKNKNVGWKDYLFIDRN
jgi:5-methylcytosine-specific restriction endonuclease McrA